MHNMIVYIIQSVRYHIGLSLYRAQNTHIILENLVFTGGIFLQWPYTIFQNESFSLKGVTGYIW